MYHSQVKCKVALVGHSQIPRRLNIPNVEVNIFRAPGAKASTFFDNFRLNEVLKWEHDLTILWIGSNDIGSHTEPETVFNFIKEIYQAIQENCKSVVYVCKIEPRLHPRNCPTDRYKKIQCGINNRIKKRIKSPNIHFNNLSFVEELGGDGVHWSEAGRERVESKFKKVIKGFIGEDETDE